MDGDDVANSYSAVSGSVKSSSTLTTSSDGSSWVDRTFKTYGANGGNRVGSSSIPQGTVTTLQGLAKTHTGSEITKIKSSTQMTKYTSTKSTAKSASTSGTYVASPSGTGSLTAKDGTVYDYSYTLSVTAKNGEVTQQSLTLNGTNGGSATLSSTLNGDLWTHSSKIYGAEDGYLTASSKVPTTAVTKAQGLITANNASAMKKILASSQYTAYQKAKTNVKAQTASAASSSSSRSSSARTAHSSHSSRAAAHSSFSGNSHATRGSARSRSR